MGAAIDPVTSGPVVDEHLSTSVGGVFACGNVLHVHDLVDYVSEEAERAGMFAARYVNNKIQETKNPIKIYPCGGIRYTVPQQLYPDSPDDRLTIRFRVDNNYYDRDVCIYLGNRLIKRVFKKIMAPGEMEQIVIKKEEIIPQSASDQLKICTERRAH